MSVAHLDKLTVMTPHLRALYFIAGLALLGAIVLTVMSAAPTRSSYSSDLGTSAALQTWSNFLLILTAIAGVGALVLGGVERALRSR